MRILLTILFMWVLSAEAGRGWYFANSGTDQIGTGIVGSPYASIAKANSVIVNNAVSGDSILFKSGDVFPGALRCSKSGIYFGSYGGASPAQLTGMQQVTGWTTSGGNIWQASISIPNRLNIVTVDSAIVDRGCYPNYTDAERGFLHYGPSSISQINAQSTPTIPAQNWIGGEILFRSVPWIINHYTILSGSSGSQFNINANQSECASGPLTGFGFKVMNHPGTLDQQNEWYYSGSTLQMYSTSNPGARVQAAAIDTVFMINDVSDITIKNLTIYGANGVGFYAVRATRLNASNFKVFKTGLQGICYDQTQVSTLKYFEVGYANFRGIEVGPNGKQDSVMEGWVHNTSNYYTLMHNGNASNLGLFVAASETPGVYVRHVRITNTAYNALSLYGTGEIVENFSDSACLLLDDGAAFYTGDPGTLGRRFVRNIALNTLGSWYGSDHDANHNEANSFGSDDLGQNETWDGNTGYNSSREGLGLHNGDSIKVINNLIVGAKLIGMSAAHDNNQVDHPTRNVVVANNTFVSLDPRATVGSSNLLDYNALWHFATRRDSVDAFGFGTSYNNKYWKIFGASHPNYFRFSYRVIPPGATCNGCSPADSTYQFGVTKPLTLEDVQRLTGLEKGSTNGSYFVPYTISSTGSDMYPNGQFTSNANDIRGSNYSWTANGINGGSLKVVYPSSTKPGQMSILFYRESGTPTFLAGHRYRIRFSIISGGDRAPCSLIMYSNSGAGGNGNISSPNDWSAADQATGKGDNTFTAGIYRTNVEKMYIPSADVTVAYLSLSVDSAYNSQYILVDDLHMEEVTSIQFNDPLNYVKVLTNPSTVPASFTNDGTWMNDAGQAVGSSVTIPAYGGKVLFKNPNAFQYRGKVNVVVQ